MRLTCGGWHRPFTFHCTSPTNLTFVHYQPQTSSTHVHHRGPARPRLTPTPPGTLQGSPATQQTPLSEPVGAVRGSLTQGFSLGQGAAMQRDSTKDLDLHSHAYRSPATMLSRQAAVAEEEGMSMASGPQEGSVRGSGNRDGASGEPVTSLHAVHHGREVLCCALLPRAQSQHANQTEKSASQPCTADMQVAEGTKDALTQHSNNCASPFCLLTGSEDRTMRQLLYSPPAASTPQHNTGSRQMRSATDGQGRPADGQRATSNGPADLAERQGAGADGRQGGLFGAAELGFQAAGSAVKSVLAISFDKGVQNACKASNPRQSTANYIAIVILGCSVWLEVASGIEGLVVKLG